LIKGGSASFKILRQGTSFLGTFFSFFLKLSFEKKRVGEKGDKGKGVKERFKKNMCK